MFWFKVNPTHVGKIKNLPIFEYIVYWAQGCEGRVLNIKDTIFSYNLHKIIACNVINRAGKGSMCYFVKNARVFNAACGICYI